MVCFLVFGGYSESCFLSSGSKTSVTLDVGQDALLGRLLSATTPPRDSWLVKVGSVKWWHVWWLDSLAEHFQQICHTKRQVPAKPVGLAPVWINWVMHHDLYKCIDQHAAAAAAACQPDHPEVGHTPKLSQWVKQCTSYILIHLFFFFNLIYQKETYIFF